ncbi:hypothetical protein GDO81_024151 [Engystomops pustulosus]|uniref:Uncharacterized protein n=1 Tax=Engystomops pustulosus TaxID=76066 RepID=A0AAV6Z8D0_ENGPU|nr:hypothetical protein GDO81_024151 [Engystomops pustulosus]
MESLSVNKTLLNQFMSFVLENPCIKCPNSNSTVTDQEGPYKLTYILLLMGAVAFFTLMMLYSRIFSKLRSHSKDPYHTYIVGKWKAEEQHLVPQGGISVQFVIGNQALVDTDIGAVGGEAQLHFHHAKP